MKQGSDIPSAYPHLRAAAAARSNATVERLRAGITVLQESGVAVAGPSIYEVTGLAFKTIQRKPPRVQPLLRARSVLPTSTESHRASTHGTTTPE